MQKWTPQQFPDTQDGGGGGGMAGGGGGGEAKIGGGRANANGPSNARPSGSGNNNKHDNSHTEVLCCCVCTQLFCALPMAREPVGLACGHVMCRMCVGQMKPTSCPLDGVSVNSLTLPTNVCLLRILQPLSATAADGGDRAQLGVHDDLLPVYTRCVAHLLQLTAYLHRSHNDKGASVWSNDVPRSCVKHLVYLICYQLVEAEGRQRAIRACRSLCERCVNDLLVVQQSQSHVSSQLWTAVRARGCQFLGPAMQEEVLRLILLTLSEGALISRKNLVMYIVQTLEKDYPQASKTCVGHVVQLLYRASCFNVFKREAESSLMQLKCEYRDYDSLRAEHDTQIVQIATEAGLRISPDQWSSLLYADQAHRAHMQSIIDGISTPGTLGSGINELLGAVQRTGDTDGIGLVAPDLLFLAALDAHTSSTRTPSDWPTCEAALAACLRIIQTHVNSIRNKKQQSRATAAAARRGVVGLAVVPPAFGVQSSKYKTSLCREVVNGRACAQGNYCTYAHSMPELHRYRQRQQQPVLVPVPAAGVLGAPSGLTATVSPLVASPSPTAAALVPGVSTTAGAPAVLTAAPVVIRPTLLPGEPSARVSTPGPLPTLATVISRLPSSTVVPLIATSRPDTFLTQQQKLGLKRDEILRRLMNLQTTRQTLTEDVSGKEDADHVSYAVASSLFDDDVATSSTGQDDQRTPDGRGDEFSFWSQPSEADRLKQIWQSPEFELPRPMQAWSRPISTTQQQQHEMSPVFTANICVSTMSSFATEPSSSMAPMRARTSTTDYLTSPAEKQRFLAYVNSMTTDRLTPVWSAMADLPSAQLPPPLPPIVQRPANAIPLPSMATSSRPRTVNARGNNLQCMEITDVITLPIATPTLVASKPGPVLNPDGTSHLLFDIPKVMSKDAGTMFKPVGQDVGQQIDKIVQCKETINAAERQAPPCAVEKQQLRIELNIINKQLQNMDRRTEVESLISELELVDYNIQQLIGTPP